MLDKFYIDAKTRLLDLIKKHGVKHGDFTLSSGKHSNLYIDLRPVLLSMEGHVLSAIVLIKELEKLNCTHVACNGVGSTHMAAALCSKYSLSAIQVRDSAKKHGTKSIIELPYDINENSKVVLIDDVLTTGISFCRCINVLGASKINPLACVVLVDREDGGVEFIDELYGIKVISIFSSKEIIE